jgi:carbon-monoxide dehydrogenase medium subunit
MYAFEFHRPKSVSDAAALLAKSKGKLIAGGQSLVGALKLRLASPGNVIDLGGIAELRGIKRDGGAITIGASTRHAEVAASPDVRSGIAALAELAGGIGDRQVRNMGTLGGSLANNDPAADYPAAVLGLGATIRTNKRTIAADDFFKGMYETALADDELITAVSFPLPQRAAYIKFRNPASRFALVGVFVSQGAGGVRVAVTGAGSAGVFRATAMEQALTKSFSPDAVRGIKVNASQLNTDLHATAEYRSHLVTVLTGRAVAQMAGK